MKNDYEKHQREYTVLGSSIIAEWFYSKKTQEFFSYKATPIYYLIQDEIFYHFVSSDNYATWPISYFKKYSKQDFINYAKVNFELLKKYRVFLKDEHLDAIKSLSVLHQYMRDFIGIILVACYASDYVDNLPQDTIDLCVETREKLEDVHKVGMTLQKKLLNKIENNFGIDHDTLEYLTIDEYNEFIKNKKLPKGLKKRKEFLFLKNYAKGIKFYSKKEADKILDKIDETRSMNIDQEEIAGSIGFPGKATGRVVNIRKIEEANNVKEGDVIVASMTDPRYVQAMKKAVAFVTDEGGVLCHASIVAREMKKPCIIGTKIATQVLKDGDLVEVDADKGIVKIVK